MYIPIDESPLLCASLGKARVDRIRYAQLANTTKQPRSRNIPNELIGFMQDREIGTPGCWVDDIIQGVARLDHGGTKPLSALRLYNILQCVEMINTRELMALMNIEVRQAQRYLKATKLIMQMINRHFMCNSGSTAV